MSCADAATDLVTDECGVFPDAHPSTWDRREEGPTQDLRIELLDKRGA
jgi:hypothetical protein